MKTTIIERRLCIDARHLNSNFRNSLIDKIREETHTECSEAHGHIISILRIAKIVDNYVSNVNCDVIFTVQFEAETLKPMVGDKLAGSVCMVFDGGVFLDIKNRQKILISRDGLGKDFEYNQLQRVFESKQRTIDVGDILTVEIAGSKYKTNTFCCFGRLVE